MQSGPVLEIRNLSTAFLTEGRWNTVVDDVSLTVGRQETVAVVGESGSGKSVTALSAMRLLPEQASRVTGSVLLEGRDLLSLSRPEMRRVRGNEMAMIFQEPMTSLNPVLTIGFQIAETLVLHRNMAWAEAEAEAVRLLERVRIPSAKSRFKDFPHAFSGGMRQRAMIAMALACKPRLLIADEPTTALDVTVQSQLLALLADLQREDGMSVLFITHDMGVVAEIADRVVVMSKGRIVEAGETAGLFSSPTHPYTRALLHAVPKLGSMTGQPLPKRFPRVDLKSGRVETADEALDTVDAASPPVLKVSNVTARFDIKGSFFKGVTGRVHAVEGVSFSLQPGETLALVGESGCGKTTPGRSIVGLNGASGGTIEIGGQDVGELARHNSSHLRRQVQMIFQDPFASLNPRSSVGEAIGEPLAVHGIGTRAERQATVANLLSRVGLDPDMAKRYPHEFSGGQRQRICIARALALKPRLIVADEAVSALDVSVKAQVLNLMLDLQEAMKLAYLFITHDMAVVERVCHRVAVMHRGEIVEIGPRDAVFANPQHPYTRKLLEAVPIPDPSLPRRIADAVSEPPLSPVRAVEYQPPPRHYRENSPGHLVQMEAA
jgi:peptide/nickel transport system ATP-binding protein